MISLIVLIRSLKKRTLSTVVLLMTILGMLLFAVGCENQMSTKRGVISGLVLDQSGNRVVGALLTSHRSTLRAETDKNGHYEFTSLDVGTHRLSVEKNGYYLASRTVELGYGEVLEGIDIIVENLPDLITWQVAVKETDRVVVDVSCAEAMSVWAAWNEIGSARSQTAPTGFALKHEIELDGLFPGAKYQLLIEGLTVDGRKFSSERKTFTTVHREDLAGAPDMPVDFKVKQSKDGPVISWNYNGLDPLEGFRIYRSENDSSLSLLFDESMLFASQRSFLDEETKPGRIYTYRIQSVDLEGNVSSMTSELKIIPAGKIEEDLTWKKSWNPIAINGDIIIPAGKTLVLEPGVNLVFSESDDGRTGYNPSFCEFIVEGCLIAEGSQDEPIRMISASSNPTRRDWDGVRIISDAGQNQSILKYVEISGAEDGIALYNAPVEASHLVFRFCQNGLSLHGVRNKAIDDIRSEDCDTGVLAENSYNSSLTNLKIKDAVYGVIFQGNSNLSLKSFDIRNSAKIAVKTGDKKGLVLRNGLLHAYETGLDAGGAISDYQYLTIDAMNGIVVNGADVPVIKNNIIVNRQFPGSGNGIEDKTLGRSYPYNNIYNFKQPTFNCDQNGGPVLNLDPAFVGGTTSEYDYHLQSSSPIISASENGGQPGAYGAPPSD
ncbi:MAG: hypothetical protein Kow0029_17180 [Candidatus Rifleibacteriota bacterium]